MNARRLVLSATSLTLVAVAAFSIAPADFSTTGSHDRLSAGVFLGVLDNEADTSEGLNLPPGRFNLYIGRSGGQWLGYDEQNARTYKAKSAIKRPDAPAKMEATFNRDVAQPLGIKSVK